MTDHEDALSRGTDPWSSREIEEIIAHPDLLREIVAWIAGPSERACGEGCRCAADFEITIAMLPFFPEVYEGEIRRQMRILRKRNKRLITLRKSTHYHKNPDTGKRVQVHTLLPRRYKKS